MLSEWLASALLFFAACGSAGERSIDADLAPYYLPCGDDAGACPTPYECTTVMDAHLGDAGTRDVCLISCNSNDDCPFECCKGFGCSASVGEDGYCVFI